MKNKRILGLDLGTCTFKMALLEIQEARPVLLQARLLEIPAQSDPAVRLAALKTLLEGVDLPHLSQVVSVVDDPFSCLRRVSVPPMPRAELMDAVKWELQRFLAVPPEEAVVDYKLLGQEAGAGAKKQNLLAAALPVAVIREHLAFLTQAGVRPTQLIPKPAALSAWLRRSASGPAALLEVGASVCEFIVMEGGDAIFTRKIPGGGAGLTREMTGVLMTEQGQVSLTEGEAETIKRSIGIPGGESAGIGMRGVSGMQIFSLIRGSLERLAVETERSLSFYGESGGQSAIAEVALVGGGAHLKGLAEWLGSRLGLRVAAPNIFEGFHLVPGALQGQAASMELSFAAVLGAALGAGKGINLLPFELQESLRASIQRAALKAAVTGGVLAAVLLWVGLQVYQQTLREQIAALELEREAVAIEMPSVAASVQARDRWQEEPDWHEVFRGLTHQVPPEITLTEWTVDGRETTLRGRVRKGNRSANEILTRFIQALNEGFLAGAALRSSRQVESAADQADFEIGGRIQ